MLGGEALDRFEVRFLLGRASVLGACTARAVVAPDAANTLFPRPLPMEAAELARTAELTGQSAGGKRPERGAPL